jgi:hypothetical protein
VPRANSTRTGRRTSRPKECRPRTIRRTRASQARATRVPRRRAKSTTTRKPRAAELKRTCAESTTLMLLQAWRDGGFSVQPTSALASARSRQLVSAVD